MSRFLILVGPTRTGTTSLFRTLSTVAGLVPSTVKETNHFLAADAGATCYRRWFRPDDDRDGRRVFMEASPLYFGGGCELAANIRSTLAGDDVGILITLRDPVDRLRSLYRHIVTKRPGGRGLAANELVRRGLSACACRPRRDQDIARWSTDICVLESCYGTLASEWTRVFDQESIRVCFFDVFTDPARFSGFAAALGDWLGCDASGCRPLSRENASRNVRNTGAHRWAVRANDRFEPLLNRMPWLREQARSLYYTLNERAFDDAWRLEPEVEQALAERLETEVAAVRRLIADDQLRPLHGERPAWL
jgi:hypothetical protein